MGDAIEPARRQDAKMNSLTLLLFCLIVGANALSFQGHDVKSNVILVDGSHVEGRNITDKEDRLKNEERQAALENQRLIVLGRLTKKVLEWLYYNSEDLREWILQNLKNYNVDLNITVENLRMKRSLNINDDDLDWMNAAMITTGVVLDLEDCRKRVICTTCSVIKEIIPVSTTAFVVVDPFFTESVRQSQNYLVAKRIFFNED